MNKILIVDDDEQILDALSKVFSDTDYEAITVNNGSDALKILDQCKTDLIISDMKMPFMNGYELLSKVKQKYPHIIRISLSGYVENSALYKASLHNIAIYSVFKPWNGHNLVHDIDKLFYTHNILSSKVCEQVLVDTNLLLVLPVKCYKLLSLIEEEKHDTLISELENDTELSALLMDSANSSIYGAMPGSIKQIVKYIGLHNLKSFLYWAALTLSINHSYEDYNNMDIAWKHGCCTNKILLYIYEAFFHKQPPEAALFAGLLHNTGYILLKQKSGKIYDRLEKSDEILNLENEKYGTTHQEIGGFLLNSWDLPFPVVEAALYHHKPLDPAVINKELVFCVNIAQHYAWKILNSKITTEIFPEAFSQIDTDVDKFEKILDRYLKKGFALL